MFRVSRLGGVTCLGGGLETRCVIWLFISLFLFLPPSFVRYISISRLLAIFPFLPPFRSLSLPDSLYHLFSSYLRAFYRSLPWRWLSCSCLRFRGVFNPRAVVPLVPSYHCQFRVILCACRRPRSHARRPAHVWVLVVPAGVSCTPPSPVCWLAPPCRPR